MCGSAYVTARTPDMGLSLSIPASRHHHQRLRPDNQHRILLAVSYWAIARLVSSICFSGRQDATLLLQPILPLHNCCSVSSA